MVQSCLSLDWTNTKYVLLWSNFHFSLFGPIRNAFFFGPIFFFLYLDQFEVRSSLVQFPFFFTWTNSKYALLWSIFHFSLLGPIRSSFFFGPFFIFLYLDQFEMRSSLVHFSFFFIWTKALSRNIKKRLGEGAFLLVH